MGRTWCLAVAAASASLLSVVAAAGADDEWQPLFNGKDLTGWHGVGGDAENWRVADGVLSCTGEDGSRWLRTEREYADFELRLEFKVPEDGNSGVFVRMPLDGRAAVDGPEIQILDDYGPKWRNLRPEQFTGAIYAAQPPSRRVTKVAGQWQSMRIRLVGRCCAVWINGEQVIDADLDALAEKFPELPGLQRATGYIGLQNHSTPVYYRNIQLRNLAP